MDSSVRCTNLSNEDKINAENWMLKAMPIQQQYYEKDNTIPWQYINGDREVLKKEIQETLFGDSSTGIKSDSASSKEKKVDTIVNVIYKQIYNFSQYKIMYIKPFNKYYNGNIKFPVFSIVAPGNKFVIDQDGCLYCNKFQFMKVHNFIPFVYCYYSKTLKVHDFQALLNEVKCGLHQKPFTQGEINASKTCCEEVMVTALMLCHKIYETLGLTNDFAVRNLCMLGKKDETHLHFPVIRVAYRDNPSPGKSSLFFVDHIGRFYRNWKSFLETNIYPATLLCYPCNGTYQADHRGKVLLDISYAPACGILKKSMIALDVGGTIIGFGSLAVVTGVFGFVPIAAGAICGLTSIIVGSYRLHDHLSHKQSLNKLESVSFGLSIATGVAALGGGALSLAKGLAAGGQIAKEAELALKGFKFLSPQLKVVQNVTAVIEETRRIEKSLRGIEITMEDVDAIFSHIKKQFIKLKNMVIEFSDKVKMYLVKQWYTYFSIQENHVIAEGIVRTISLSEKLDNYIKVCESEEEFLDLAEVVTCYIAYWKKQIEKEYLKDKIQMQKNLGDNFDESILKEKYGFSGGDDLESILRKKMNGIDNELEQTYKKYMEKVPVLNEVDGLRFHSNTTAVHNCFRCCVHSQLMPEEYFALIRRVTSDDKSIVNSEECDFGKRVMYYDDSISLTVIVLIIGEEKFLVSTHIGDEHL